MKRRTITPQEEFTGRAPELNRTTRVMKVSPKAWLAALLSFILSFSLIILFFLASSGTGKNEKIVLFYCEKRFFPYVSMKNSLAAAGFDFAIVEPSEGRSGSDKYVIPDRFKSRQAVVASFGKDAFKVMDDIAKSGEANVAGYCLINPGFPGNAALEGYGRNFPETPVAIFDYMGGSDPVDQTAGSPMLYEKFSGADTVYGVPAVSGTIFKNEVYITPDQSRYLSLSNMRLGAHVVRYMPTFENELARYLGVTYGNGFSSFRIKAWFTYTNFAAFASLALLSLFVFLIPVRTADKGSKELKGRDSLGTIVFGGLSAWIALTISVMTFIPVVAVYARYAVIMTPAVLTALMALMRLPFLLSKKIAYKRDKLLAGSVFVPMAIAVCEVILILGVVLVYTDISGISQDTMKLAAALIVFIVSCLSGFVLARADRKSRFSGEGPAAYFGNPAYFIETLLPAAALLVLSIMRGNGMNICYASMALACGVLPFVAAVTIKRFSDFFEAVGFVYGTLMAILVYIAL
ncbi:MAG: hypothetical protein E7386_11245 [Ruminococcaceae bacterium]|nr:hypothetical protein [Oscillospiraceae bacterium]